MLIESKHDACGSGPVVLEDAPHGFALTGWRAICCACWMHGPVINERRAAIEAWSDPTKRVEWRGAHSMRRAASKPDQPKQE